MYIGMGTPRNLDEAVQHAICNGPLSELKERSYHVLRDYLAQKFAVATLDAGDNKELSDALVKLFDSCAARGVGK